MSVRVRHVAPILEERIMIVICKYKDSFDMADWYLAKATKASLMSTGETKRMALNNLRYHMKCVRKNKVK